MNQEQTSQAAVSTIDPKRRSWAPKTRRGKMRVAIAILVIIGLAVGGFYAMGQIRAANETKAYNKAVKEYKAFMLVDKVPQARDVMLDFMDTKPRQKAHKRVAEANLAAAYQTLLDNKNAKIWLERAIKDTDNPGGDMYMSLGNINERLGDKPAAIDAYTKALAKLENDKTTAGIGIKRYVALNIKRLQGVPKDELLQ